MADKVSEDLMSFLHQIPLLQTLDAEALVSFTRDFRTRRYKKGAILFHQGDLNREFYIVRKGRIRIFMVSPAGGETSIAIFQPGDILGEFSAIDDLPRSATAQALSPCTVLEMSHARFVHHLRHFPDLSMALSKLLIDKLRWTASYAESVAQYDAAGRLLHTLLLYKDKYGVQIGPNKYELDLPLTQATLASLIGARREWINRLLQEWRKRNLLEYKAGKITILDLPGVIAERNSRIDAHAVGGEA